jgi:hypothetical protein
LCFLGLVVDFFFRSVACNTGGSRA